MIQNIQTMRVLFTFLVVTAHLASIYTLLGVQDITMALARVSVDGFIVVSAFLIPYTHAQRQRSPIGFLGRRLARLVPFYWFMTFAVAALALAAPHLFQNTVVTWETLFKSLFFIPYEKQAGVIQPIVFVGWTMNLFVLYMVVHAISLWLAGRAAWLMTACVLVVLMLAGQILKPTDPILLQYTSPRLMSFVAGLLLCEWWLRARDTIIPAPMPRWFVPLLCAVALGAYVLISLRDVVFPGVSPRPVGAVLACIVVGAVIVLDRAGAVHRSKLRDAIADASFAIYLTHFFLTQAAIKLVQAAHITSPVILTAILAVTYVGVAVVGVLANRFVENPLETIVRKAWGRRRGAAAPVTPQPS